LPEGGRWSKNTCPAATASAGALPDGAAVGGVLLEVGEPVLRDLVEDLRVHGDFSWQKGFSLTLQGSR
jgi:hypothetical protein